MATPLGILRIKLELRVKQTWHLIGRSVDAHLFIVHWGFLDACLDVVFIRDFDMLDYRWLILLHWLAHWFWFCHACSDHFTCIHSPLYITRLDMLILWLVILFWPSSSMMFVPLFVLIVVFSLILCVYEWYILLCLTVWCMTALPLHDCMSSVYVGLTSIPLPPTLLVSVIPFISVLTIASVRPSVCLLSDRARD